MESDCVSDPEYESDASSEPDRFSDPGTEVQLVAEESLPEPAESLPEPAESLPEPAESLPEPAESPELVPVSATEEPKPVSVPDIELNPASFNTPVTDYHKPLPGPDDEWRKRMRMCVCTII